MSGPATKIVFAGFGGQGVLLMGYVTALAAMREGRRVTYLPAYGAEMRGGSANCTVAISDDEIASPVASAPDLVVVMNNPSCLRFSGVVKAGGRVLVNSSLVRSPIRRDDVRPTRVAANDLALELGEARSANVVMLGALAELAGVLPLRAFSDALAETRLGRDPAVLALNRRALEIGARAARGGGGETDIPSDESAVDGTDEGP
jgi:2-oxoglutarate ferredoxin oxidoreductase subunit gamma